MSERLNLNSWMLGATESHVFRPTLVFEPEVSWLDDFDELLHALDIASPLRLGGKKRHFRQMKTWNDFHSLRAEFLVAKRLLERGIAFEFGEVNKPTPDLILSDPPIGIEITRRHVEPVQSLQRELREALWANGLKPKVILSYSTRPFSIRTARRNEIILEVIEATKRGEAHLHAVVRPSRDNQKAITVEIDLKGGKSVLPTSRWKEGEVLKPSLLDVEDLVTGAMEDKRKIRQALALPSILVVDITGVEGAETRKSAEWAERLGTLLKPHHKYIGLAIMINRPQLKKTIFALAPNPHANKQELQWVNELGTRLR